ncbi:hypothetical protein Hanom_Chr07g00634171 [Helianthus anomalus]
MIRIPTAMGPMRGGLETGMLAPSWAGAARMGEFSPCSCIRTLMRSRGCVEHPATMEAIPPSTKPFSPMIPVKLQILKRGSANGD